MKITRSQLSRIIKEETTRAIREANRIHEQEEDDFEDPIEKAMRRGKEERRRMDAYGMHNQEEGDPNFDLNFIKRNNDLNLNEVPPPAWLIDSIVEEVSPLGRQNLSLIRKLVFEMTGAVLEVRDLICLAFSVATEQDIMLPAIKQIYAEVKRNNESHADD